MRLLRPAILALLGLALGWGTATAQRAPLVLATHVVDEDVRMDIRLGQQPSQSPDGLTYDLRSCRASGGDVRYELAVDSPYATTLTAVGLIGFDGPGVGTLWGFVEFVVPPGPSTAVIDSTRFAPAVRRAFLTGDVQRLSHRLLGCSFHLVGFQEGPAYAVDHPVRQAGFD